MKRPERRFAFQLAIALGSPHPDYILSQISSRQFSEWIAYQNIEPFGEWRADLRSGIIASTIANANRGKKQTAVKPSDFMPEFKKRQKQHGPSNLRQHQNECLLQINRCKFSQRSPVC